MIDITKLGMEDKNGHHWAFNGDSYTCQQCWCISDSNASRIACIGESVINLRGYKRPDRCRRTVVVYEWHDKNLGDI